MTEVACHAVGLSRVFRTAAGKIVALHNVSFSVRPGETLAVIGESGAGKSSLVKLVAGLDRPSEGTITVAGAAPRIRRGKASRVQVVFQNPGAALSPHHAIGTSVAEPIRARPRQERQQRVHSLLERVGISPSRAADRPTRFSGGELQRIVLARALVARPALLLCDEPTSALDVSVQAQVINLLLELQREEQFASIVVTHDLAVAKVLADNVLVLREGEVQELTPSSSFFDMPTSEYGRQLSAASSGGA